MFSPNDDPLCSLRGDHTVLHRLSADAWCEAHRRRLASAPLTPDRLCQLATHTHRDLAAPTLIAYYLTRTDSLLSEEILFAGRTVPLTQCLKPLSAKFARGGAAKVAFSLDIAENPAEIATRIALFCQKSAIPLLDIAVSDDVVFFPILRASGVSDAYR